MTIPEVITLGSVRVERTLAQEGESALLLGSQPALERVVTIRRLSGGVVGREDLVEGFLREARLGARIHHPNVVAVLDCFRHQGDHYLVLEHVEGETLARTLEREERVPEVVALSIGLEVARGLEEAHARGIYIAALAPERIVLTSGGEVKIRGLDRARERGEDSPPPVPASPYRAPEIARREIGDGRSDLYSLGALLCTLLTGEAPLPGDRPSGRRASTRLSKLIGACLLPEAADRPQTIEEVREALEGLCPEPLPIDCRRRIARWLRSPGITVESQADSEPNGRLDQEDDLRRAPRWPWIAGGAALGTLLIGLLTTALRGPEAPTPTSDPGAALPAVSATAPPARVRIVAEPWAEVQVDKSPPFLTPRAEPVELSPGQHEVVFRHPSLGTVRRTVRVKSGERRLIREILAGEEAS